MSDPRSTPYSDESREAGSSMHWNERKKEAGKQLREAFQKLGPDERGSIL
jgi:hypothetical protein